MTTTALRRPGPSGAPGAPPARRWLLTPTVGVVLLAVAAGAAWLPFLATPLSADEGGFLMLAEQWAPGTSLYGDYWVDRPPLLVALFRVAAQAGGAVPLRLLGAVAVVVSVVVAGLLGRRLVPSRPWAAVATAATAAVFLGSPLFNAGLVDGEVLAVPFVLAGLLALTHLPGRHGPAAVALALAAGVAGTAAAAVKQNELDAGVAAAVLLAWLLRRRRAVAAAVLAVAGLVGSGLTIAAVLGLASSHGTTPAGLWEAVVTFRLHASHVIGTSASSATSTRGLQLAGALALSGAPLVLALALGRRVLRDPDPWPLRPMAAAVVAWEAFAVVAGGSYWQHYLVGLVPGVVLAVAVVLRDRPERARTLRRVLVGCAGVAVTSLAVAVPVTASPSPDAAVATYLSERAGPHDTAVIAFGHPELLRDAGLSSPYPLLWSLPVRVRDPHLHELARVLRGPDRPTWVVVAGTDLATWGVDAAAAEPVLQREYVLADTVGEWSIYRVRP